MGLDERHYNINTLNKLFAIASLILLLAVGLLVLNDYSRKWKDYQTDFQNMEVEKTRVKLDGETNRLKNDPELTKIQEELKDLQKSVPAQCAKDALTADQAKAAKIDEKNELLKQQYRVVKAQLDAAKFQYEEISAKGESSENAGKVRYEELKQKAQQLNLAVEKNDAAIAKIKKIKNDCSQSFKDLDRKQRALSSKANILSRKLKKIDPNEMDLTNRIANLARNLPVLDLANPTHKVQQIVLKDVREDNNFMALPRVDRCTTCHLGIANPDYKDAAQPLRTHPNLELYVSKDSLHSMEDFGCTVCHDGRGRGTDFTSAAHTPSSEEQAKEWKEKYGWEEMHHWDKPMLAKPYVQAGCFKCHSGQTTIKGADKLNLGMNLIERAGCYACHNIDKYKEWPKPGPSLTHLASKTNKEWSYRWISDPKSFRHTTWMPSYFNQSNNSDPESKARSDQEIHAIVDYLFTESEDFKVKSMPSAGDAKKGEELVASVGCFACHVINKDVANRPARDMNQLRREQGPNLIGFGNKTSKVWLYEWLKDPNRYHPQTRMPNLRLTDEEAANIAAYLSQDTITDFNKKIVPPIDEKVLDQVVLQFLKKSFSQDEALEKLSAMKQEEKLHFAGQKLIAQYGCYSCHDIKGFSGFKPIGTDLTEQGSKTLDKLAFGFVKIDHSKEAWYNQKLQDPRIFDTKTIKAADEKSMMPNFNFTKEETEAITTAILGFVKDKPGKGKPRTADNLTVEKGQQIVREFNCQGCHVIENEGGVIKDNVTDWLIKYEGKDKTEADTVVKTFSPPNLNGIGRKTQAQWLFEFLHQPETVRPWLKVRMPTYSFDAAHLNSLLKYFNALDKEEFPFTEHVNTTLSSNDLAAAQKLFSQDYFACQKCHIVGDILPTGSQETWAPNLALAGKRLKPEWVIKWIRNPSAIDPTTKMPTFFDPQNYKDAGPPDILNGDEDEQIRVLRDFIMSISSHPPLGPHGGDIVPVITKPAPAAQPAPAPAPAAADNDFWGDTNTPAQK